MASQSNLVVHITLPAGLALTSGAFLDSDLTIDVVGQLTPFYASIDQVRLNGGMFLRKLSDITIAAQIYDCSKEADLIAPSMPPIAVPAPTNVRIFVGARNQWVLAKATRSLLLDISMAMAPSSHVLANFSVTRMRGGETEGLAGKLAIVNKDIDFYELAVRTSGAINPGGRPHVRMAAKGVFDWSETTPSRGWRATGLGANAKSLDFGSPTGGRGKPVAFFANPLYSAPIFSFRSGSYQGAYPLTVSRAYPYF